jgi:hypothetical protein
MSTQNSDLFEMIFGVPLTTPTIPINPPERADFAKSIAERHRSMFDGLRLIGADYGGGMTGIAKGLLPEYVRRSMITERDRNRLYELFDILAQADTEPEQLGRLPEVNDEIVNDPESSEIALAVAAVALEGVTHSAASGEGNVAVTAGATLAADAAGLLLGSAFGLAGGVAASVVASVAAESATTS